MRIQDAVVSYREDVALRGVSLDVERGEFVGVVGPNGAGKTTLLTVVNGMGQLCKGDVWVLGRHLNSSNKAGLRKRIGYIAQTCNIDPRTPMTVREVAAIGRYGRLGLLHWPKRADWEVVDRMLDLVGMTHLADRPIGHLSGGEQQRVAIARCLAQEPEILLLDEPTASLDWRAQRETLELVRLIHNKQQLTTMFVTHDLNSLPGACDRVVLMKEGLIWRHGHPQVVLEQPTLDRLFDAPVPVPNRVLRPASLN